MVLLLPILLIIWLLQVAQVVLTIGVAVVVEVVLLMVHLQQFLALHTQLRLAVAVMVAVINLQDMAQIQN
jgi:hypothetical protein